MRFKIAAAINNETPDLMASWFSSSGGLAPDIEDPNAVGADPDLTPAGTYALGNGVDPLVVVAGETLQNIPEGAMLKWSREAQTWYVSTDSPGGGGGGSSAVAIKDNDITEVAQATFLNFEGAGVTVDPDGAGATITISGGGGGSDLAVEKDGTEQIAATEALNFVGSTVAVSIDPDGITTNITIADPVTGIAVNDIGVEVEDEATILNFEGLNVTTGAAGTVNIQSSAEIWNDGTPVSTTSLSQKSRLNFKGAAVSANYDYGNERIDINVSPAMNDLSDVSSADAVEGNILKRASVTHNAKATIDIAGVGFKITSIANGMPGTGNVPQSISFINSDVDPQFVWDAGTHIMSITARFPLAGDSYGGVTPYALQSALYDSSNAVAAGIITMTDLVSAGVAMTNDILSYSPFDLYADTEYVWKRGREIVAMDTMTMVNADFTTPTPGTTGGHVAPSAGGVILGVGGLEQPSPVVMAATKQLWPDAASGGSDNRFGYVEFDYNSGASKLRISTNENVIDSTGIQIKFEPTVAGDPLISATYSRTGYDPDPLNGPPMDTFTIKISDTTDSVSAADFKNALDSIQGAASGVDMLTVSFDPSDSLGDGIINWNSFPRPGLISGSDDTPYIILNGTSNNSSGWTSKASMWRGLYTTIGYEPNNHLDLVHKGYVDGEISALSSGMQSAANMVRATAALVTAGGLTDLGATTGNQFYNTATERWADIIPVIVSDVSTTQTVIQLPAADDTRLNGSQVFIIKDEGGTAGTLAGGSGHIVIRPAGTDGLDEYTNGAPLEIQNNFASITLYTNGNDMWHII